MKILLIVTLFFVVSSVCLAIPTPIVEMGFGNDDLVSTGSANETGYMGNGGGAPSAPVTYANGVAGVGSRAANIATVDEINLGSLGLGGGGVADAMSGLKSFTMTMWINVASVANIYPFLYVGDTDTTYARGDAFGRARCYVSNIWDSGWTPYAWWNATNQWNFLAWTVDLTQTTNNANFYWRTATAGGMGTTAHSINVPAGALTTQNGTFRFGENVGGLVDNIRVYGSKTDTSGILSMDDLNALHAADLAAEVPEPATLALLVVGSISLIRRKRA
jgi:hypothetical protein